MTRTDDAQTLRLEGNLDIYEAEAARAALLEHLADQNALRLDLIGITTCDAAGVQLLCAARKSALQAGQPFSLAASPAILECRDRLGLSPESFEPVAN